MKRYLYAGLIILAYTIVTSLITTGLWYLFHNEGVLRVAFFGFGFMFCNIYLDYVEPLFDKE